MESAAAVARFAGCCGGAPRADFLCAIERLQPISLNRHGDEKSIAIEFDLPLSDREALRELLVVDTLPPGWHFASDEKVRVQHRVAEALELLAVVAPSLRTAMDTVVGTFVMAKLGGYEGGSRSSVVGAIWLGLRPTQPPSRYAGLIVHEFVHQCLFLEDMVHGVFVGGETELAQTSALVTSALRHTRRGYDKSFHSAFVAATLTRFHLLAGEAERAQKLREPLLRTLGELVEKKAFLTANGRASLAELAALVAGR